MNLRKQLSSYIALNNYVEAIRENTSSIVLTDAITNGLTDLQLKGSEVKNKPETFLDSVVAKGGTEQRNLPVEYQELEYIADDINNGTKTVVIDTGIAGDNDNLEFEFESYYDTYEQYGRFFGNYVSDDSNGWRIIVHSSAGYSYFNANTHCTGGDTGTLTPNTWHKVKFNNQKFTIDGVESNVIHTGKTKTNNENISLFSFLSMASHRYIGLRYKHFIIRDNGVLVRNFIPAKRLSDNVLGMYDTVSGQFFTNAGTGTFTAGPVKTPTPDTPMDIVSNNGVLKVSPNLFNKNASYALFNGYINNASVGGNTTLLAYGGGDKTIIIKVVPNTTYTVTRATNLGSLYNRIRCAAFTTLPSSSSTGVVLYNLSSNTQQANATFTTLSDTQYVAINVRNSGAVGDDWTQFVDAFQLEKGSAATQYRPYGQIYTDGTVETIKDSLNNTATAEMLLKVGTYQDKQEILSGAVTRKIGVKVLDGTEDWVKGQSFYCDTLTGVLQADHSCYCTHYQGIMNNSAVVTDSNTCRVGYHIGSEVAWDRLYIYADRSLYATAADFANYLAQQYAAGTPVIVIYPLATPTTESVAGQILQVQTGDNVLEITQASLTGLELEAEYQKG